MLLGLRRLLGWLISWLLGLLFAKVVVRSFVHLPCIVGGNTVSDNRRMYDSGTMSVGAHRSTRYVRVHFVYVRLAAAASITSVTEMVEHVLCFGCTCTNEWMNVDGCLAIG